MELIVLNEKLEEIDKISIFNYPENHIFTSFKNISDINESDKKIFNTMDYDIKIYSPTEKLDDFYVSFLNNKALKFTNYSLSNIKGVLLSDLYLTSNNNKPLLNKMKEVYNTNKPQQFYFEYYNKNFIIRRLNVKIIKLNNFIYILGEDETDYNFISGKKSQLFEEYKEAIAIVQNDKIVKYNKRYSTLYKNIKMNTDNVSFSKFEDDLSLQMNDVIHNILERNSYSDSFPFEINKNGSLIRYFILNFNYIFYNHKPAVMIIYNDITEQELNRRHIKHQKDADLFLSKTVDFIQSITNTGLVYTVDGKYKYSSKICELLEIEPEKLDENKNIIKDMVIKEDQPLLNNNHNIFELNHKLREFIIRIKTSKNNIKYLQCYLMRNDIKNNTENIAYYKDITEYHLDLEKLYKAIHESKKLERNLEKTQKISKTAVSYNYKGKSQWTKSSCEILKINPNKYKNYHGDFLRYVIKEDQHKWHDAHKRCSPINPETNFLIRIKNSKDELVYLNCYIIFEYDRKGNEIRHVNFYEDITEQINKEDKLKKALDNSQRLKQNFKKIEKISKISMSYVNDVTNEVIFYNKGYQIFDINYSEYPEHLLKYVIEEDKYLWEEKHALCTPEHPEIYFTLRTFYKDKLKYIRIYVAYVFDDMGDKISHVDLYQDITNVVYRQNQLQESLNETIKLQYILDKVQSSSKTAIGYSTNLQDITWTPEIFNILEIDADDYKDKMNNLMDHFVIKENLALEEKSIAMLSQSNPDITINHRVKTGKDNIKYIKTIIHQEYDNEENIIRRIGFNQDITREMEYQNQLKTALNDKEVLLSEVHHRVKNNLQIILSLINMNLSFDSNAEDILENTQNRIYAMALIHEKIYGSASLSEVNMKDYIESLVTSLFELYDSDIKFHLDMESLYLDMDQSIPMGLIINELVTNTIRYAFPNNEKGNLFIEFKKEKNHYILIVKDDGIGLPEEFDLENLNSLGLIVVTNLTLQIGGIISVINCEGTGFKIEFEDY